VTIDDKQKHSIIVWKIRHAKSASVGIPNLELQFVTSLQLCLKVLAVLVRHCILGEFLFGAEQVKSCCVWVRIADSKTVLELQSTHKRRCMAKVPSSITEAGFSTNGKKCKVPRVQISCIKIVETKNN